MPVGGMRVRPVMETLNHWREARWERQRTRPPRRPRGWEAAPPDFVGVGVERAGTSWWYRLVAFHPEISHRGRPKELRYFHRFVECPLDEPGVAAYAEWFPRPPGRLAGEWTPSYMSLPRFANQLWRAAPRARLLMILRDPIERVRSALTVRIARGGSADPPPWIVQRSLYSTQIEWLRTRFPQDAILILQYERCVIDPAQQLARTYRFLGVDDGHRPWLLRRRVNVTPGPKALLDTGTERRLLELYADEIRRLPALAPDVDLGLWPCVRRLP